MKNKGFTLVELIAVVVVLGIIAIIAIPAVSKYMYAADDEFYVATENTILASGRDYFSDYTSLLPKNDGDVVSIDVNQELVDGGYMDEIKNNDEEVCNATLYVTRVSNNDYKYCVIVKCGDKVKGNTCGEGEETPDIPSKDYSIINDGNRTIEQCSTYNDLLNMVDNKFKHNNKIVGKLIRTGDSTETPLQNNGVDILIYPDEGGLNLNAIGRYKFIYEHNSAASTSANVDVVDVEGPNQSELKITFNKSTKDGTAYSCDNDSCAWSNKNIVITFVGKDLTTKNNCNQPGSGIANFMYKLEGVTTGNATLNTEWRVVTAFRTGPGTYVGYVKVPENEFKGKIYYNAIDAKGNYAYQASSAPNRYLKIDTVKPKCVSSGGNSSWVNTDITITGTCSDTQSGCTSATSVITKKYTSNIESTTESPGTVKDNAGNSTDCPADQTVKIDKNSPTCTNSGGGIWTNSSVTIVGNCTDTGGSQCTGNASVTYSSQQQTYDQSPGTVYDNAGNFVVCPSDRTILIDKENPKCTAALFADGTSDGVTAYAVCTDTGGSGCVTPEYQYGLKSNTNLTVTDNAGNSGMCVAKVTSKKWYRTRTRTCSVCGSCSSAGCAQYNSGTSASVCGTYTACNDDHSGTICDAKVGSYTWVSNLNGCTITYSGSVTGSWGNGYYGYGACPRTCRNSAFGCATYNSSCDKCGCSTYSAWSGYSNWTQTACSGGDYTECSSETRYYFGT